MRRVGSLCFPAMLALMLGPAACSHEISGPRPDLDTGQEGTMCGDVETTFVVRGSGLSPMVVEGATDDPDVRLPTVCLVRVADVDGTPVSGEPEVCVPEDHVEWISQSELRFRASGLGLTPGEYDVIIRNPDGQEASQRFRLRVLAEGPLVFWVDPPVVYNGISTQITIYGTGLGEVTGVAIRDSMSFVETTVDFTVDPAKPNRIGAIVPSGTPTGTYDIVVTDDVGCAAELPRGLRVTDALTLTLEAIDPSFGWTMEDTAVTITGAGFVSVPRAYFNPAVPTADTVASALASVAMVSAQRLTAVVPEGLPPDLYDLIVVNPDGAVGLIEDAFRVTADAPPVIDSVTPASVDNDTDKAVTITGTNFRSPTVSILCLEPDGTRTDMEATVGMATATTISATIPSGGLPAGTVCIIRVTNDDGSYFDYSAIAVTNPASNLASFVAATTMTTPRRAPAVAAGRATRAARFLYAVGGDDGATAGALASVDSAAVDIFGEPGDWFAQPVSLPGPRTLAGIVTLGRFLYLVGGNDGTGATDSVLRAQVLDPAAAPEIVDVAARRGMGSGLGAGVWYYRVSAIMADDDPNNPGGETLASDPLVLNLPMELSDTLVMTLFWDLVPGAKGYRVYRSPTPDLTAGNELLLTQIDDPTATSYEDASGTPSGAPPLPLGATGVWVDMPALGTAREAAGIAAAHDPVDPALWHIYAAGGRSGMGRLDTIERGSVTLEADGTHTVSDFADVGGRMSSARAELALYSVSHSQAIRVPEGTTYLYAGGGESAGTMGTNVDVAQVQAGGDLGAWSPVDPISPGRWGYAALAGADFLFAFGGQMGRPTDGGVSAEIDPPPDLVNWNNEGVRLTVGRYLCGAVVESAFIYIVGGETDSGVTASTERTVL